MEYFQIEGMFGKRQRPLLALHLQEGGVRLEGQVYEREFTVGIENRGRAVARFPSLRFKNVPGINVNPYGIDGNYGFGLPRRPTESELVVFGGGADHVIYPGTVLMIAKLDQRAKGSDWIAVRGGRQTFHFEEYIFSAEISAEEALSTIHSKKLAGKEIPS